MDWTKQTFAGGRKTYVEVPNRKRKGVDENLEEERERATKGYKTLAKRMQYEKPSYIDLTDRVANRIAKDILYHETIMEHFMDQPAYKFIMNVASFTNDDVSKFWSDHIKTNKPAPYELGDDVREMAVRIARERADQDVHQWCKLIKVIRSRAYDTESESDDETDEEIADRLRVLPRTSKIPGTPSGSGRRTSGSRRVHTKIPIGSFSPRGTNTPPQSMSTPSPISPIRRAKRRSPLQGKTPQKVITALLDKNEGYEKLFDPKKIQKLKQEQKHKRKSIDFQEIKSEDDFVLWMRTKYYDIASEDIKKSIDTWKNDVDVDENFKKYYYDCEGLRFTRAPRDYRSARFEDPDDAGDTDDEEVEEVEEVADVADRPKPHRRPTDDTWCHEDPCGYEYINLVKPYYKRRFDFHIHDYLKNHYEEKMAYEIQKWYNSSPASIKKIFFAPVIYGHMNEVTFALTHRYTKFRNCKAEDFYSSGGHAVLFAKCVALAIRGSQVLSGKKYGLDKSFMRINLEKRRAMHAWKHIGTPNCAEHAEHAKHAKHAKHAPVIYRHMNEVTTSRYNSDNNQNEFNGFLAKFVQ